jgi:hypothetical protein
MLALASFLVKNEYISDISARAAVAGRATKLFEELEMSTAVQDGFSGLFSTKLNTFLSSQRPSLSSTGPIANGSVG